MRYKATHKEETRRRVIEVASRNFRQNGLVGTGVASIMADAGLTNGAFFTHFRSKEALIEEVFEKASDVGFQGLVKAGEEGGIEGIIRRYLRPEHRDHPERGCPAAALGPEVARHSPATRAAFTRKFQRMVDLINSHLPAPNEGRAQAIFGTLIGAMQLARSASDAALSDQLLNSGIEAALILARA